MVKYNTVLIRVLEDVIKLDRVAIEIKSRLTLFDDLEHNGMTLDESWINSKLFPFHNVYLPDKHFVLGPHYSKLVVEQSPIVNDILMSDCHDLPELIQDYSILQVFILIYQGILRFPLLPHLLFLLK